MSHCSPIVAYFVMQPKGRRNYVSVFWLTSRPEKTSSLFSERALSRIRFLPVVSRKSDFCVRYCLITVENVTVPVLGLCKARPIFIASISSLWLPQVVSCVPAKGLITELYLTAQSLS